MLAYHMENQAGRDEVRKKIDGFTATFAGLWTITSIIILVVQVNKFDTLAAVFWGIMAWITFTIYVLTLSGRYPKDEK